MVGFVDVTQLIFARTHFTYLFIIKAFVISFYAACKLHDSLTDRFRIFINHSYERVVRSFIHIPG
ncbi:hypothetical protein K491DRAFT_512975 [Lophiostoma macrostomum CBS 122681]|uniref:Uncharacterized protein n=1 Tax=Lophiostoma macrostomum CBS 122681 TaxID=1314788 RepID=A0A6A6T2V8_9PLEO|nr:hypothetical protein K491DRAFT_512975 [Lophiostoma macrostomum CBS 122681]